MKFKVGDRVRIREDSEHCGTHYNPDHTVEGTVSFTTRPSDDGYVYDVGWDNTMRNCYREEDLELIEETIEIQYEETAFGELEVGDVYRGHDSKFFIKVGYDSDLRVDGTLSKETVRVKYRVQKVKDLNVLDSLNEILKKVT